MFNDKDFLELCKLKGIRLATLMHFVADKRLTRPMAMEFEAADIQDINELFEVVYFHGVW